MAVTNSLRARYEDLREASFGAITDSYTAVGAAFANPARIMIAHNTTNSSCYVSYDGVSDKSYLPANSSRVLDYSSNKSEQAGVMEHSAGERFYVKYDEDDGAPTRGKVLLELVYADSK